MEVVENLIVGAGPAGLRAAQVLAESGREVLVLEKRPEIGPKVCAGGLTGKTMRELEALGLPAGAARPNAGHVGFAGGRAVALPAEAAQVHTIARRELGRLQLAWTRAAGADVRSGVAAVEIDLGARTIRADSRRLRWHRLLGADGADSAVRRALGLPCHRAYFAAEYNLPTVRLGPLRVECDPEPLANGYFWVFPHETYTSVGAVARKDLVPPPALKRYLDARADALGVTRDGVPFEGATLETAYRGCRFPRGVYLAGDAAGMVSSLTAEGIYGALVSGEEVALGMLEREAPAPKTARWLATKRWHDRIARGLARPGARALILGPLARMAAVPSLRRPLATWFLRA